MHEDENEPCGRAGARDLENCFLVPYAYGKHASSWPRETVLLYEYENASFEEVHGMIRNDGSMHAEQKFIDEFKNSWNKDDSNSKKVVDVTIYINYSPCANCAQALITFKEDMLTSRWNVKVKLAITFANFYKINVDRKAPCIYEEASLMNEQGLIDLMSSGVQLKILDLDELQILLNNEKLVHVEKRSNTVQPRQPPETTEWWHLYVIASPKGGRHDRVETVDRAFLKLLQSRI